MGHQLKAVIFDLDGVLCDTSRYHAQAWTDIVRELGHEPPMDLEERVRGVSRDASMKIALGAAAAQYSEQDLRRHADRKNEYYINSLDHIGPENLFPGVLRLFDDLLCNGIKIALGSASKNARTVLARLGILDRFDAIADGFAYTHGKPHPEVFLKAAEMLDVKPCECIVIEDAAAGITAALAGGFVAVGMGQPTSLAHAHCIIKSLEDLNAATLFEIHAKYRPLV